MPLCHKNNFSDKKKQIRLHTIVTGLGMESKHIITKVSVQQNPGRAAKVVGTKPAPQYSATLSKTYAPDGTVAQTKMNLKLHFDLNCFMKKDRCFNSQYYAEQLGHDLTQHAKYLMGRDVHNFGMVKSESTTDETLPQSNYFEQKNYKTEIINVKLMIPDDFAITLGNFQTSYFMGELKQELEVIANSKIQSEMRKCLIMPTKSDDLFQTRRQLVAVNNKNATLLEENRKLIAFIESMRVRNNFQNQPAPNPGNGMYNPQYHGMNDQNNCIQ